LYTQTDLELAIGGAQQLAQLLDKDGDGIADASLVASIIGRSSAEVMAAVGNVLNIATMTPPYPDALVFHAAQIGAYYAWGQGSSEIVVPDAAMKMHEDSLRFLDQLARRERSVGVANPPASVLEVKQIDVDNGGTLGRTTRDSLRGFW
jgi:phage gp36-like protein